MLRTTAAKILGAGVDRSALGAGTYFAVANEVPGISYDRVGPVVATEVGFGDSEARSFTSNAIRRSFLSV